ncbi:MAG: PKD domain-containing protein [Dehalococcoidia bacterium]
MSKHKFVIFILLLCSVFIIAGATGCGPGAPSAQFTVNATSGNAPLSVWFTDLSAGEIESWEWDFDNDGVVDSTDQYVLHVYEVPGDYTVKLTVMGTGKSDSEVKTSYIVVSAPECKADFTAEPRECHGATKVQFTDLSTGDVTGWAWDLNGDGAVDSTTQNPAYTYSRDGLYTVTLTVTSANCSDTITKQDYISVSGCST